MSDVPMQTKPPVTPGTEPEPARATPEDLDRILHSWQSRFTAGRSPSTVALAFMDWTAHAANAPFTTAALGQSALKQWQRLAAIMAGGGTSITMKPEDHRFSSPAPQSFERHGKFPARQIHAANSMIGWLVAQGRTVFCISWRGHAGHFARRLSHPRCHGRNRCRTEGL